MYHRRFDDVGDGSLPDWVQPFTEGLRDEEPGNEVALARTPQPKKFWLGVTLGKRARRTLRSEIHGIGSEASVSTEASDNALHR